MFDWVPDYVLVANFFLQWSIRIGMALVIIMRRRSPASALAWLGMVAFFPIPGMLFYFLIGENHLGQRDANRHRELVTRLDEDGRYALTDDRVVHPKIDSEFTPIANLALATGGSRPLGGNQLQLIDDTESFIDALVNDIDQATHHCHLLYYIVNDDDYGRRVSQALMRAAERGVQCRFIVDAVGSGDFVESKTWRELADEGVQLAVALPVNALRARVARLDLRNHRKLAIIDGQFAYSGSHNLTTPMYPRKEAYGAWIDATLRIIGPAVHPLQRLFIEDWGLAHGELPPEDEKLLPDKERFADPGIVLQSLPTGPLSPEGPLHQIILQTLHLAREEVIFTTPYFVPDDAAVNAMIAASRRGVHVVLVVPHKSDNRITQAAGRSHYGLLLDAGIEIQEYTAGLLHAKTLTVDRDFGLIGTANLDLRSFYLNFEIALLVYDDDFASELRFLQQRYISNSVPLSKREWSKRPFRYRLGDNIAKLLSPLL